jgi:hypothetical protein
VAFWFRRNQLIRGEGTEKGALVRLLHFQNPSAGFKNCMDSQVTVIQVNPDTQKVKIRKIGV